MLNSLVWIKIKERLNKRDSSDYDFLECWQVREAYNKAQIEWVRRQLHGMNQLHEGDEETRRRVEDLQILIKSPITLLGKTHKQGYFETETLPEDYFAFKRITPYCYKGGCENKKIMSLQKEEVNVDVFLNEWSTQPSFDYEETFHIIANNKIKIYTNNDFEIKRAELVYYRKPKEIDFGNCKHVDGALGSAQHPEFSDDVVELIIDDAVSILAADIENLNQFQLAKQRAELNN